MSSSQESNAAVWKSDQSVAQWVATAAERERGRGGPRAFVAELLPFDPDEAFTFVDLGAGTGAGAQAVLDRYPNARAVLADYSPQMMAEGERALAAYAGRYSYVEFDLAAGPWPSQLAADLPAVITSLCVHHLPDERKRELFAEIYQRLAPGGWFINYDPVAPPDAPAEQAWQRVADRRDPDAAVKRAHRTPEEQRRWANHVRHIAPLQRQLDDLQATGFQAVDAYWKELDHAVYAGQRPA